MTPAVIDGWGTDRGWPHLRVMLFAEAQAGEQKAKLAVSLRLEESLAKRRRTQGSSRSRSRSRSEERKFTERKEKKR